MSTCRTKSFNVPTLLTWARLLAIPCILIVFHLPIAIDWKNTLAAVIFSLAAFTDWLDGWLARRWGQTSAFGAFLDPVADKLIVCIALLLLVWLSRLDVVIASVIIARELTVSALREWMARMGTQASVTVHNIGKVKTLSQLVSIPLLMLDHVSIGAFPLRRLGYCLICGSAVLTVWSMFYYLRCAWPHINRNM